MKKTIVLLFCLYSFSACTPSADESSIVGGGSARRNLLDGNKRYVEAKPSHPGQTAG